MSTNQRKGADAERAVVRLLRDRGWPVDHRGTGAGLGYQQRCDIPLPDLAIEVRNRSRVDIGATLAQLAERNPGDMPLLIVKPIGVGLARPDGWFAVTYVGDLFDRMEPGHVWRVP